MFSRNKAFNLLLFRSPTRLSIEKRDESGCISIDSFLFRKFLSRKRKTLFYSIFYFKLFMNFIKDYFAIYNISRINFTKILKNVTKNENLFLNIFNLQKVSSSMPSKKRGNHAGKSWPLPEEIKKQQKNILNILKIFHINFSFLSIK